jgi:hypothetical protein
VANSSTGLRCSRVGAAPAGQPMVRCAAMVYPAGTSKCFTCASTGHQYSGETLIPSACVQWRPPVLASVDDVDDVMDVIEIREQAHKPVYALLGGSLFDDPFLSGAADLECSAVRFAGQAHGD